MATNRVLQLENGVGLGKVVVCSGLSFPAIIHPLLHGEPVLTAQAFYYLSQLDSVAKVRFENPEDILSDDGIEYLIDNYLFEYSKRHPESTITFKVLKGKFWYENGSGHYLRVDQGLTEVLAVDVMNDESVESIVSVDLEDRIDLNDWDIGRNYTRNCLEPYVVKLTEALDKKVDVRIWPGPYRDGYFGKLRVIKPDEGLLNYDTAMAMADICIRNIAETDIEAKVGWIGIGTPKTTLPVERIVATRFHNPVMLSHYFSGLHELNALKSFVGFYNVLEYYFEEAPRLLGRTARNEKLQIECVVELLVSDADVTDFIGALPSASVAFMISDLPTSSSISIVGFNEANGARKDLARWLYEIRCAVIHSKKTRKGVATATFEPYTSAAQALHQVLPVIRWLAIKCIEADSALNPP
ncbi:hypothetical protein [Pseudomonas sp. G5(2012)]|uniref:hypothetical protein n=1 Tax=Pseudomonas sp. G5(2012) TaxID=1268068 RepID=UPI000343214D|nr:hypothetical protein [Pseudomonas sp. G5(2012)]EPA97788.1 hypothetical protein PG5_15170 [Pseudomonas sp. G5(2012)]